MPASLRIALLECDKPLDNARIVLGGHAGVWKQVLAKATDDPAHPELQAHSDIQLTSWDVVAARVYPQLGSVDGVLVSGSRYNAFDDEPWIVQLLAFVIEAHARNVRLIGVCFGHQIIARALGSSIARSLNGWEVGVKSLSLTDRGQHIFGTSELALNLMNRDVVASLPAGVENLAFTDKCAIHGMYAEKKLITVQGHPEFSPDIERELLQMRNASGLIPNDTFSEALERVDNTSNGVTVAQAFIRFLIS